MVSLKKQALKGIFWSSIQQFSRQGIGFIVSVVLARLLLPKEFGLIAMITIFIGIGNVLLNAGLGQSLIRTTDPTAEDYSTVFFFNLGSSIVIYFITFGFAPMIATFYNEEILTEIIRWYGVIFIINAFAIIQTTRLTKEMDFKTQLRVSIPATILGGIVGISLAYLGYGVWSLVVMAIVQSMVSTVQLWIYTKWNPSLVFNVSKFKYHFKYGYKLTLAALIDVIFVNSYSLIIGKFFTTAQVGYYHRADSLKQLPVNNISSVLNKVTFPLFAKIKDDDIQLKRVFKKMMQMVVFIITPILIFSGVLAEPLFRFLFTAKWLPAVPYFQILCVIGILYPLNSNNLNILRVKGRSDLVLKLAIFKKSLLLGLIIFSIQFGIYGLLYSQVVFSIIGFIINSYYSGKLLNYPFLEQLKDIIPIFIVSIVCGVIIFITDRYIKLQNPFDIIRLVVGALVGGFCFIGLSFLMKISSFFEVKNVLLKKIR